MVTKIPRFTFEKFRGADDDARRPQMKSVGEAMAIGRTFKESLQKALRSLEIDSYGFDDKGRGTARPPTATQLETSCACPNAGPALVPRRGASARHVPSQEIYELTKIDPWFLDKIAEIVDDSRRSCVASEAQAPLDARELLREAKRVGFSDRRLAELTGATESDDRASAASAAASTPVYKTGRHLRRRVRGLHAVPLLDLRGRGRGRARPTAARS